MCHHELAMYHYCTLYGMHAVWLTISILDICSSENFLVAKSYKSLYNNKCKHLARLSTNTM